MPLPDGSLPGVDDLLDSAHVVRLRLHTRFRGLTEREAMLLQGPHGWGEFAPFLEYDDRDSARWLAAAVEAAWSPPVPLRRDSVPINATVPAVPADRVDAVLARFPGCTTAKVKVAESGQTLADDVARLARVREVLGPSAGVRVDANGAWDVGFAEHALTVLARYRLEYAEQPCGTLAELSELRRRLARRGVRVPIAADESVRKADDPLAAAISGAADVVVLKVAPLGGVRPALAVAARLAGDGLAVVVSSALDTSVGLAAGVRLAAAVPELRYACGLGTAGLLVDDVTAEPLRPRDGRLATRTVVPDPTALQRLAVDAARREWWLDRLRRVHGVLAAQRCRLPRGC